MKYLSFLFALITSLANAQFITNTGIAITNNAKIQTNGAWQNSGNFRNNGTIITSEAWQNTGTMDVNSTGGFILQYVTPKSFSAGSNAASIGFIWKEGAGDVTITGSVLLKDSLKIISGLIKMNTVNDKLGITPNSFVLVSDGSYVEGSMEGVGAGTFLLPLGRDGNYLPVKFYNSNSPRVTAVVEPAPGGYNAGDAVQSLFGFPYVWHTTKANAGDTARYIEVQAPDALLGFTNIIVTRQVSSSNQYEAMGTKTTTATGIHTSYKSYDRGLQGIFSLGLGYSGDPASDSVELENLYDSAGGSNWIRNTNWRTPGMEVIEWEGFDNNVNKIKGGRVVSIVLSNNGLEGFIPDSFVTLNALQTLDLSDNWVNGGSDGLNSIPDLTIMQSLVTADLSGNNLDFSDLEVNSSIIVDDGFEFYENQAPFTPADTLEGQAGFPYEVILPNSPGGTEAFNSYKWIFKKYFGGTTYDTIVGATSSSLMIAKLNRGTIGNYKAVVTNSAVPGLKLVSDSIAVEALANISGVLKSENEGVLKSDRASDPLVKYREMKLLQITSGGYDTIQFDVNGVRDRTPDDDSFSGVNVSDNGSGLYEFREVLLRDYIINGFADTTKLDIDDSLIYLKAIPTWYNLENSEAYLWQEADTLVLESDSTTLDFVSTIRPEHPTTGFGSISGTFYDGPIDPEGKINKRDRVKKAGVPVSRYEDIGRGYQLVLILTDYVFTNDEGEFSVDSLEAFEYRLNLQYPGYPMDETSFIDIPIVDDLFGRQVFVEAYVNDNQIYVEELVITGWEEANHGLQVFPNPTTSYLYISDPDPEEVRFTLYDATGRGNSIKATRNVVEKRWEIDIRELNRGVYILEITRKGKVEKLRVIVQ